MGGKYFFYVYQRRSAEFDNIIVRLLNPKIKNIIYVGCVGSNQIGLEGFLSNFSKRGGSDRLSDHKFGYTK